MDQYKDVADTVMRSQIGRFGITGPQQTLAIKNLSDGLKSRVVLAWLAYKNPHMLLLDEPVGQGSHSYCKHSSWRSSGWKFRWFYHLYTLK